MPKKKSPRPYHHGNLKAALTEGARALLQEAGGADLSLREVARRVGVSHAAAYRHFADKSALLAAIAAEGFLRLESWQRRSIDAESTTLDQLRAIGTAYVKFAVAHPEEFRLMFSGDLHHGTHPELAAAAAQAFSLQLAIIEAGQEAGLLRAGLPTEIGVVNWALAHGVAALLLDGHLGMNAEEEREALAALASDMLFHGLLKSG